MSEISARICERTIAYGRQHYRIGKNGSVKSMNAGGNGYLPQRWRRYDE